MRSLEDREQAEKLAVEVVKYAEQMQTLTQETKRYFVSHIAFLILKSNKV